MTKKTALSIAALALATAGAVPAAYAGAAGTGNGFIGAKVGTAFWSFNDDYTDNENDFSYAIDGGYRWNINDSNSIGIELGYIDFGSIADSNDVASVSLDGDAVTLGANYQLLFGANGANFFEARAGYMHWNGDASATLSMGNLGTVSASGSDSGGGVYVGAGIGHYFTPNFALSLNYDFHQADAFDDTVNLAVFTIGAEYRF